MSELLHQIVQMALSIVQVLGVWGILLGLALEVIPSEIVLAYGGYLVSRGDISFVGAIVFGTIGCLLQQVILYWLGRYGGRPVLDKFGKYLHLKPKHLDTAEGWFNRYGPGMVFFARFVPVLRQAISIPAGMARMPLIKFLFYTLLGTLPWALIFVYLGRKLGDNWEQINESAGPYVQPLLVGAFILALLYIVWKMLIRRAAIRRAGTDSLASADEAELPTNLESQRSTAQQLKYIGGEYRVIQSYHYRSGGATQQIDHIVIGPNGVFYIDSKHWPGEIRLGEEQQQDQDPTALLYRYEYALKELLKQHKLRADIVGIVCFTHPDSVLIGTSPSFTALKVDRLVPFIKNYKPTRTLSPSDVALVEKLLRENNQA